MNYVTAKTFPLGPDSTFQSEPAERAYLQAKELGCPLSRDQFRLVLQAYQCAQDESQRKYDEWVAAGRPRGATAPEESPDPNRCQKCGWPYDKDPEGGGCHPGDCSQREKR